MSHTAKLKLMEHLSTRAVPGPGACTCLIIIR